MVPEPKVTFHRNGTVSVKLRNHPAVTVGVWVRVSGDLPGFRLLQDGGLRAKAHTLKALRPAAVKLWKALK